MVSFIFKNRFEGVKFSTTTTGKPRQPMKLIMNIDMSIMRIYSIVTTLGTNMTAYREKQH